MCTYVFYFILLGQTLGMLRKVGRKTKNLFLLLLKILYDFNKQQGNRKNSSLHGWSATNPQHPH